MASPGVEVPVAHLGKKKATESSTVVTTRPVAAQYPQCRPARSCSAVPANAVIPTGSRGKTCRKSP